MIRSCLLFVLLILVYNALNVHLELKISPICWYIWIVIGFELYSFLVKLLLVFSSSKELIQRYTCFQFLDKEQDDMDEDLDFKALENGFVSSLGHFFLISLMGLKLTVFILGCLFDEVFPTHCKLVGDSCVCFG